MDMNDLVFFFPSDNDTVVSLRDKQGNLECVFVVGFFERKLPMSMLFLWHRLEI